MAYVDTGYKTFSCAGTVPRYGRVKLSGASVVVAVLTDPGIGIAMEAGVSGQEIAVKLWTAPGTFPMIAVEAMAAGAKVYTEAAGKCQDTAEATSFQLGWALEAATADGDIIEVMPNIALGSTAAS